MVKLSTDQKIAIEMGRRSRRRLIKECKRIAKRVSDKTRIEYIDSLISGDSGVGKSLNIKKHLEESNVPFVELTGNVSLFALMGKLMLLHATKPKGQRMVIFLDDCDFMFDSKNINILKHMTATKLSDRRFEYTVKINEKSFSEQQQQVLPMYTNEDSHGLVIPCDEFIFVIASNKRLASEQSVKKMTIAQQRKAQHELAIRGRMQPYDFILNKKEKWGWLYDVAINDNGLYMIDDVQDKLYLLDWIWNNWDQMKETSVRTIQKMGYEMIEDPEEYKDNWELDYLDVNVELV